MTDTSSIDAAIALRRQQIRDASAAGDVDAFASLYTDNCVHLSVKQVTVIGRKGEINDIEIWFYFVMSFLSNAQEDTNRYRCKQ